MSASPSTLSVSDEPPRKKLRKGTHSCVECRRRKKSCVPRAANPGTCEECFVRGVQCRSQEVSLGTKSRSEDGKHNLQQRVAELETALLSISQKLETPHGTNELVDDTAKPLQQQSSDIPPSLPVEALNSNPEALLQHAPVLSLFDNAIISRRLDENIDKNARDDRTPPSEASISRSPPLEDIRRSLLSLFPPQRRQEAILNASSIWWATWQDIYPSIFGPEPSSNVVEFVADLKRSRNVQKVAKALLCLLIILQEKSVSLNTGWDMTNAADRTNHALSTIDGMVLGDDELAGTIDGIECIILRANYESNKGRIRKAWLTLRRGISFAQLLGLHKRLPGSESNTSLSLRGESLWKALYTGDRFLSLLLGLPYGPSEIHSNVGRDSELSVKGLKVQDGTEHFFFRLSNIVGHIIDRNQQLPSNNMLSLTFKIEAELMELAASMTSHWWESGLEAGGNANKLYSQLLPQFLHHQARTLLHLPYMLKATTDRRFEYNKAATLESAREMIACYRAIRPMQGFGSLICKVIDFQVFTAGMVLVLNLLDHYSKANVLDHSEADKDQELISITTDILQRASDETDGGVATQAARALDIFGKIKELPLLVGQSGGDCTTKVLIPYFGTVVIGPGTSLTNQAGKLEVFSQPHQLPTPSDQSLDGSNPGSVPPVDASMASMIPFDFNSGEDIGGIGTNGDASTGINFDLGQDWNWFWNNIDIPSLDVQGMVG